MGLKENLKVAEEAIAHVRKTLPKGASNKRTDRLAAAGGIEAVIAAKVGTDETLMDMVGDMRDEAGAAMNAENSIAKKLMAAADVAAKAKCGNCGEQAAVAFVYLANKRVRPVEYVQFSAAGYDHVWVVIGRVKASKLDHLKSWGPDAVWCDPWQGDAGMAFSVLSFAKGEVRNTNAIYKCDSAERVEKGKPESVLRLG